MLSTPEGISHSELDGDRYFMCLKKDMLEHIKADRLVDINIDVVHVKQKDENQEVRAPPASL